LIHIDTNSGWFRKKRLVTLDLTKRRVPDVEIAAVKSKPISKTPKGSKKKGKKS
jgi:hypothetical protein